MTDKWLSVTEIEKIIGIPDATIRRYIRNHGHHLQIKKRGRSYLVANESLEIIKRIRELYDKGKQSEDVDDTLRKMNVPVTITVNEGEKDVTINTAEALIQLQNTMNEQKEFNQLLLRKLEEQQNYINTKLEERDRMLIESIREIQESKKQIAAAQEKKSWWKFW